MAEDIDVGMYLHCECMPTVFEHEFEFTRMFIYNRAYVSQHTGWAPSIQRVAGTHPTDPKGAGPIDG